MAPVYSKTVINESTGLAKNLSDYSNKSEESLQTSLLIACQSNSLNFVKNFIRQWPKLTACQNRDGLTPLHRCSENGHVDIVKELVNHDRNLCFLSDKDGRIPLHIAVIHGRNEVVRLLVLAAPNSIDSITALDETVFHLAVKNNQQNCFELLMELKEEFHRKNNEELMNPEELLNRKDNERNTVLHVSSSKKQTMIIWKLLRLNYKQGPLVDVDARNKGGFNAWELYSQTDSGMVDSNVRQLFRDAADAQAKERVQLMSSRNNHMHVCKERVPLPSQSPPPPQESAMAGGSILSITLVVTIFILFVGLPYAGVSNYDNIYPPEQKAQNATTLTVIDMISAPALVPNGFYFIVFSTVTYILGMVMILAKTWSVDIPWLSIVRAVMLLLVGSISITYALMVKKSVPRFSMIAINGSFNVSSFVAVWVFVAGILVPLFAAVVMVILIVGICSKHRRRLEDEKGIVDLDIEAGLNLLQNNETGISLVSFRKPMLLLEKYNV